ncbi:MAG: DUF2760 domain-containing protein, partial [Planctomycetota bacterium]
LDQFSDAQIGAASRPCLKQCRQTLQRLLGLQKLVDAPENEPITLPEDQMRPGRYRWNGEPVSGATAAKLIHGGWIAGEVNLPTWSGHVDDANVIAAAQISAD